MNICTVKPSFNVLGLAFLANKQGTSKWKEAMIAGAIPDASMVKIL